MVCELFVSKAVKDFVEEMAFETLKQGLDLVGKQ